MASFLTTVPRLPFAAVFAVKRSLEPAVVTSVFLVCYKLKRWGWRGVWRQTVFE